MSNEKKALLQIQKIIDQYLKGEYYSVVGHALKIKELVEEGLSEGNTAPAE